MFSSESDKEMLMSVQRMRCRLTNTAGAVPHALRSVR